MSSLQVILRDIFMFFFLLAAHFLYMCLFHIYIYVYIYIYTYIYILFSKLASLLNVS